MDGVEKLGPGVDAPRLPCQGQQQIELGRGQLNFVFADGHPPLGDVDGEFPYSNDFAAAQGGVGAA